jgi:hypothetical protein
VYMFTIPEGIEEYLFINLICREYYTFRLKHF